MESFSFVVIGANGVGKSHFIRTAMSLPLPPMADSKPTTVRMVVDNISYAVTLFELDLQCFELEHYDGQRFIRWPKQMDGSILPRVNGVLFVYDVTNKESIAHLPETLNALVSASLPAVLVANKCDTPESSREVDPDALAATCKSAWASFKASADNPETARVVLYTFLRDMILGTHDMASLRRRANSEAAHLDAPTESGSRPISQNSKHSRASSDMSLLRGYLTIQENLDYRQARNSRADFLGAQPADEHESSQTIHSMLRSPGGVRLDRNHPGYSEMDESDKESLRSLRYAEPAPRQQRVDEAPLESPKKAGLDFNELVDRLLALKLSRADQNFADVFLCLYRKFATPSGLFSAILARLDGIKDDRSVEYFTRTTVQLRIIEVVAKWVASYPNDFAPPTVRRRLEAFILHLSTEPIFSAAASQMRKTLDENVIEDDDMGWVKSEPEELPADNNQPSLTNPVRDSIRPGNDRQNSLSTLSLGDAFEYHPSASSVFSDSMVASQKRQSYEFYTYEDYEREAATMIPSYTLPLTKLRYHNFMEMRIDDIADEMTRIDWVMFSSIRIRDLVRHVGLSADQREKCKAMKNITRMISHFNHIATWVSNMILVRDKPKHRAQVLEKFMNIAVKLRQLNNYNGLAAVLSGVNGTAILRLTQTRNLVAPEVQKRFAQLGILMSTQKGYFAYRLAWENSPLPRIPFIPLHRRDLVSAEEGSITFVGPEGDRLNWRKFEILGEVILPIMKSQSKPYSAERHDSIREIILDCLLPTDEEDVYQRSVQVESTSSVVIDPSKKKFPWFAANKP
ncbi:RAP guanine nucleotide exchange factor 4 [Xylaria sp. CBS 124048]|nr:RAP guanine nucleotide exchange factor 4 [Xylaria sp. CBS 124048]